jgi:hypothetical protein
MISLTLLADLVVLLLVLGVTGLVLLGWGKLTWRLLAIEQPSRPSVLTVWLGFCIVVASLEIIHLFIPIDWKVTLIVSVLGVFGQRLGSKAAHRSELISLFVSTIKHYPLRSMLAAFVVVIWCVRAMEMPTMFDSGFYHFGSIRWLNEHAIVPGLGNLHWRLALNQSIFGFLALLNIAPFWGKGYAAGGLFLLLLTALTLLEIGITQPRLWRWIFGGILFSYLCLLSVQIANPLPDTVMALLQIAIFIFLYCNLTTIAKLGPSAHLHVRRLQIVLTFLCLTIVTTKLSSVGFAAASFGVVVAVMFASAGHQLPKTLALKVIALLVLFTFVHIGRSYLLSGAPFFPSPFGGWWSLTWAVPIWVADNESQLIYAWAKQPGIAVASDLPAGFGWFEAWFLAFPPTLKYLLAVGTLLVLLTFAWRRMFVAGAIGKKLCLGIPLVAAFIFWFFTAPDPRFLGATIVLYFVWSLFVFGSSVAGIVHPDVKNLNIGRAAINGLVLLGMVVLFVRWSLLGVSAPFGWAHLPVPEREVQVNRSGYKAFVPSKGAQCWDTELPCAVMLDDGLRQLPVSNFMGWLGIQTQRFSLSIER